MPIRGRAPYTRFLRAVRGCLCPILCRPNKSLTLTNGNFGQRRQTVCCSIELVGCCREVGQALVEFIRLEDSSDDLGPVSESVAYLAVWTILF